MTLARFAYTALLCFLLPQAIARLVWRARRQPAYLERIPERFGYYRERLEGPIIWIHAVSVGETRAAEPLVRALRAKYPRHRLLLTHMTPTGREAGEALFGESISRCYLPYDFPGAVARFLDRFRPDFGVLMETELWPNLIHACHARGIPLSLVNARLSGKSLRRYERFRTLVRESLERLAAIGAQTDEDARRLRELGGQRIAVTGNLKFDIVPPADQLQRGREWRERYGATRPVLLAASTRDGEEALLLREFRAMSVPNALLVIVPRHPQRFDEVARLIERSGLTYQRRSADQPVAAGTRVLLGDSMGEMFAYYAACDVAFVGGSLLPFGGQNMIEPCAVGRPVLFGAHTYNFADAAEKAIAAGAAVRVRDAAELMRQATMLLTDAAAAERMGKAGTDFVRAHQGATQRVLDLLQR